MYSHSNTSLGKGAKEIEHTERDCSKGNKCSRTAGLSPNSVIAPKMPQLLGSLCTLVAQGIVIGGGGVPQRRSKCAGWYFRAYALVWVFRRKLSALLVPSR